jgi:hypothetical protein
MSGLKFNTLQGLSGNTVRVASPNVLYAPGHIIQVKWSLSMQRVYYTVPNNDGGMRGDIFAEGVNQGGTIIRPLDITIKPKTTNSYIFVEFNLFYEANHDLVFTVLRDGMLIGAQWGSGYNQGKWTGAAPSRYDNNDSSTPSYLNLPWIDRPGTVGEVTYSIAAKSSNSGNRSLTLNSTIVNYQNGTDAYEQGCSFSIAQEIAY